MNDFNIEEGEQPPLVERLAEVLKENGIEFDASDLHSSILTAVQELCNETEQKKMSTILNESDSISEEEEEN